MCYESVEKLERWRDNDVLKKRLYERGLPFQSDALLLPIFKTKDEPAVLTSWKMVVKYAPTFFSSDNLMVLGPKLKWCLYYYHDEILTFARGRSFQHT